MSKSIVTVVVVGIAIVLGGTYISSTRLTHPTLQDPVNAVMDVSDRMYVSDDNQIQDETELVQPEPDVPVSDTEEDYTQENDDTQDDTEQTYCGVGSFERQGVIYYDGWTVAYYNPEVLGVSAEQLGYNTVGSPITYNSDGLGIFDGMIAVALPEEYEYGTIVDTPFGQGIVVDHSGGAMDVVVDW